jgi:hypothetical protein
MVATIRLSAACSQTAMQTRASDAAYGLPRNSLHDTNVSVSFPVPVPVSAMPVSS